MRSTIVPPRRSNQRQRHWPAGAAVTMNSGKTVVDSLLEREIHQASNSSIAKDANKSGPTRRFNAVWRQKVVRWYFTVVASLRRQHSTAVESSDSIVNPFSRASVHFTVSLLDNYLMSLPSERALRYQRDRPAYQLLATTCLLLGMRLARLHEIKETEASKREATGCCQAGEERQGGLKRAKTHKTNMNEVSMATTATPADVPMPTASAILRLSAAPRSISERHILSMVREMTGSRSFPRSRVVTALHFVDALRGTSTHVTRDSSSVSLGPADAELACQITDASLRDTTFSVLRPSVLACAAVTLALARSIHVNLSLTLLRQKVYHSIFGTGCDPLLQASIRKVESNLLGSIGDGVHPSRNRLPTTHLIPLEDE